MYSIYILNIKNNKKRGRGICNSIKEINCCKIILLCKRDKEITIWLTLYLTIILIIQDYGAFKPVNEDNSSC